MPVRLFRDINIATNIITAYKERERHRNKDGIVDWAEWANNNKERDEMLQRAMLEAKHG